jgi:NAD-dependent deacetylase
MTIERARRLLRDATRIAVLTGAGVSAESGVPTFRDAGGLWRTYRAEDLATPDAFARDPKLVWEWYDWRRGMMSKCRPNAAHQALVAIENRGNPFLLVTQNVDGLHKLAGSRNLLLLHGEIWTIRCTACGAEREDRSSPLAALPPRCRCGGLERPGVVWFGEPLPDGAIQRAAEAVAAADLLLVVGTSAVVWPAAGLIPLAIDAGVPVVEVNPDATGYSSAVISLRGKAGEILPSLL